MPRRRFRRHLRTRTLEATLEPPEAAVLLQLCRELDGVVGGAGDDPERWRRDPVLDRLFPRAYLDPTEERAESDWQRFVHDDLVAARRRALEVVQRSLSGAEEDRGRLRVQLTSEEAEAWLGVLNDARLTLGTRLEVTEEEPPVSVDPDDPRAAAQAVYWWLGSMEEDLVAELMT